MGFGTEWSSGPFQPEPFYKSVIYNFAANYYFKSKPKDRIHLYKA